jgi:hypothetical protein
MGNMLNIKTPKNLCSLVKNQLDAETMHKSKTKTITARKIEENETNIEEICDRGGY